MAAKKRPPRQVWMIHGTSSALERVARTDGASFFCWLTRTAAKSAADQLNAEMGTDFAPVGPYVLAERVREK